MSKVPRKEYGSSPLLVVGAGVAASSGVGAASPAIRFSTVGPDWAVGEGVYAGGGSFEGTVNAFIPGLSGRLVAGDGFASGLGLLRDATSSLSDAPRPISAGPLNVPVGVVGVWISECAEVLDLCDALLDLRPSLRIEPKRERLGAGSGWRPHADPVGMTMVARSDM